ncbi:MAG: GIY-YIG nuclease family protein [Bacteroidales bacterium]|nr:GIY-YIG nuclease family protein [Bacteroidales bacterium]
MYAIVDIETTGGSPVNEKITEIAIYIHDGNKIVGEYSTLINPEKKILYHITSLTGISNEMVAGAPRFFEVAKEIVELTDNCIFIAHNVSFDYHFIRNEFKRLGYNYKRDKLCTVQLSRKLIPGLQSYSLGRLCKHLGITINDRHRASGDTLATVKLFEYLMAINNNINLIHNDLLGIDKIDLHPKFDLSKLKNLPEEPGVYYFFNDKQQLIYIGKSKNIRMRILSHFRNFTSKKSIEMRNEIVEIDYEKTGNELIALLKESHEIKKYKPLYNRAQRRALSQYGLYTYIDNAGYIRFSLEKNKEKNGMPLCSFSNQKSGRNFIEVQIEKYDLCQKLCGLYNSSGACFHYDIAMCKGACIGLESFDKYNNRANKLINSLRYHDDSYLIIGDGRTVDEIAVVAVECGKYLGYGYIDKECTKGNKEELFESIAIFEDNRDVQQILRNYLHQNSDIEIIPVNRKCE